MRTALAVGMAALESKVAAAAAAAVVVVVVVVVLDGVAVLESIQEVIVAVAVLGGFGLEKKAVAVVAWEVLESF